MTPTLSHLLAFTIGLLIAILFAWAVHRKQQQDWQAEYRRLMGGINKACAGLHQTLRGQGYDGITQACILNIKRDLNNLFDGLE